MILKRHSGSKNERSIGVRASNNKNPESENDDNPLRASKMKDLRHPAKSLYQNELNLEDEIIASEEGYHNASTDLKLVLAYIQEGPKKAIQNEYFLGKALFISKLINWIHPVFINLSLCPEAVLEKLLFSSHISYGKGNYVTST